MQPFFSQFLDTHAFSQFAIERIERADTDFEILFFEESLKAKRNRSKFRFTKKTTPFLEDSSYAVSRTISALEPNLDYLDSKNEYGKGSFPARLKTENLIAPRRIKSLITVADNMMLKSRTAELVARTKSETNLRRKHEFGKWIKTKLKSFSKMGDGEVVSLGHFLTDEHRMYMSYLIIIAHCSRYESIKFLG